MSQNTSSRWQEVRSDELYWGGWPFPPLGDLPFSGTEPMTPVCPELAGRFFTTSTNFTVIIRV